jgi:hypothetical protein
MDRPVEPAPPTLAPDGSGPCSNSHPTRRAVVCLPSATYLRSGGRARTCNNQLQRLTRIVRPVRYRALTCDRVRRLVRQLVSSPCVPPEFGT